MTTIEHVKGHIDMMVSVSVRPSALNFATSSGCSASETSSCVMARLSSWRLARSYLLQSEPENTVTFNRPSP